MSSHSPESETEDGLQDRLVRTPTNADVQQGGEAETTHQDDDGPSPSLGGTTSGPAASQMDSDALEESIPEVSDRVLVFPKYDPEKAITQFHLKYRLGADSKADLSENAIGQIAEALVPAFDHSMELRKTQEKTGQFTDEEDEEAWRQLFKKNITDKFAANSWVTLRKGIPLTVHACRSLTDPVWNDESNVTVPLGTGADAPRLEVKTWVDYDSEDYFSVKYWPSASDLSDCKALRRTVEFMENMSDASPSYRSEPNVEEVAKRYLSSKVRSSISMKAREVNAIDRTSRQRIEGQALRRRVQDCLGSLKNDSSKWVISVTDVTDDHLGTTFRLS